MPSNSFPVGLESYDEEAVVHSSDWLSVGQLSEPMPAPIPSFTGVRDALLLYLATYSALIVSGEFCLAIRIVRVFSKIENDIYLHIFSCLKPKH